MAYFTGCRTTANVKRQFHELAQEHHPDHGGNVETMKVIIAEMEAVLARMIVSGVDDFEAERGWRPDVSAEVFGSVLAEIIEWNITIEIIGYWIYAFDSYGYKDLLKDKGFWFSKKHRAWVYSGSRKLNRRSRYTTDDVREMHGSQTMKEREEQEAVSA